ncbi:protein asteroid [Neocloeon triangulifer]|uniref:protein asteroid n=1 Tax=Neocloeon triangulifer TaxID=2078957 RepID=UPI00286F6680|nr:protein asteroid [Neocloeon triangulifer]
MGVRGLATFISSDSSLYLQSHRLHDCTLIVDGNSLASQLYVHFSKSNPAYGGDYDRYYRCIKNFFDCLAKCKVQPLVVFDGGYEKRKLPTMWERLKGKIYACSKVNPVNQTRKNVFPLLMRETFREILAELGVSFAQCDFEADEEIASLARELCCPVLSLDSDFFVLDVMYLPFDHFQHTTTDGKIDGHPATFVYCEMYTLQRFLDTFGGLQQEMLPLMATLLGNDYVKRKLFDPFFDQIKKPSSKKLSYQQKKIAGLIQWLRRETMESAISKVLHFIRIDKRDHTRSAIERAVKAYQVSSSAMKQYLDLSNLRTTSLNGSQGPDAQATLYETCAEEIAKEADIGDTPENDCEGSEESDDETPDDETFEESQLRLGKIPEFVVETFRHARMPSTFMDLYTFQIYIMQPQKEDFSERESASAISLPIIRSIVATLLGPERALEVQLVTRRFTSPVKELLFKDGLTCSPEAVVQLESIPSMSVQEKENFILKIARVDVNLKILPKEWRLFFLALIFWATQTNFPVTDRMVHSVVLGVILQAVVLPLKKGDAAVQQLAQSTQSLQGLPNFRETLENVETSECKSAFADIYAPNSFSKNSKVRTGYDVGVVHSLAQLQSVVLALNQLNQLLLMPFAPTPMHRLYSGTLMYNIGNSLQSRQDPLAYVKSSLSSSPSVFALHESLVGYILSLAPDTKKMLSKKKKHRVRKPVLDRSQDLDNPEVVTDDVDGPMDTFDANNRFALLGVNFSEDL